MSQLPNRPPFLFPFRFLPFKSCDTLLTNSSYSTKLLNPKWQKKRLTILSRDKWRCRLCGDADTTLHVHHSKYKGEPWEAPNEALKTVCAHCHELLHVFTTDEIRKVAKQKDKDGDIWLAIYTPLWVRIGFIVEGSPFSLVVTMPVEIARIFLKSIPKS